jgi:hypothetical protein
MQRDLLMNLNCLTDSNTLSQPGPDVEVIQYINHTIMELREKQGCYQG